MISDLYQSDLDRHLFAPARRAQRRRPGDERPEALGSETQRPHNRVPARPLGRRKLRWLARACRAAEDLKRLLALSLRGGGDPDRVEALPKPTDR